MLDQWVKITTIAAASVLILSAIIGTTIGGILWLVRLDNDVRELKTDVGQLQTDVGQLQTDVGQLQTDVGQLQTDVGQLQTDVAQLQTDVSQMKLAIKQIQDNQQIIIEILRELSGDVQEIKTNLSGHTHDPDGRTRLPLNTR